MVESLHEIGKMALSPTGDHGCMKRRIRSRRVARGVANFSKILHCLPRRSQPLSPALQANSDRSQALQVPSRDSLSASTSEKHQDLPQNYSSQSSSMTGSTKGSTKADDGVKAKLRGGGFFPFYHENMQKWQEEREHARAKKGKKPRAAEIAGKHWKELDDKEKAKWNEKAQKQASGGGSKKTAAVTKKTASETKKTASVTKK